MIMHKLLLLICLPYILYTHLIAYISYVLYTHLIAYISLNKQCVNTLFYYYYYHRRCSILHPTRRSIHPSHLSNLTYSTTTVLHPSLMCYCVIRVTEISVQRWRSEAKVACSVMTTPPNSQNEPNCYRWICKSRT